MILDWDHFVNINCLIDCDWVLANCVADCDWVLANCVAMVAILPFYYVDCPIEIISVSGYSDTSRIFIC